MLLAPRFGMESSDLLTLLSAAASAIMALMGVIMSIRPPMSKFAKGVWIASFSVLLVSSLAAVFAGQVIVANERRISATNAAKRDAEYRDEIARVQGSVEAFTKLLPSLTMGEPEALSEGLKHWASIRSQLEYLQPRRLSDAQKEQIRTDLTPLKDAKRRV